MKKKKLISRLIQESNLTDVEKYEATRLLNKALGALENQEIREIIDVLEKLREDLGNEKLFTSQDYLAPRYQEVISRTIEDYKLKIRKNDNLLNTKYFQPFDDYTPITFERLLSNLGEIKKTEDGKIVLTPRDHDILRKFVKVAEDDGQGYAASGFKDVFSGYQDKDGNIYLWI